MFIELCSLKKVLFSMFLSFAPSHSTVILIESLFQIQLPTQFFTISAIYSIIPIYFCDNTIQ